MSCAAREFADDPCSSLKRGNMVRAARNLLSAVTKLLILADMVDVHLLLKSLRVVSDREMYSGSKLIVHGRSNCNFFLRTVTTFVSFYVCGSMWVLAYGMQMR